MKKARAVVPLVLSASHLMLAATLEAQPPAGASPFAHPDGTAHWYQVVRVSGGIDWAGAHRAAAAAGGTLVTVTSAAEGSFVFKLADDPIYWVQEEKTGVWRGPWLGGLQSPGAQEPGSGWGWAEFEAFSYQNWAAGKPDNGGNADRLHLGGLTTGRSETWADAPQATLLQAYVVEFSGPRSPRTVGLLDRQPASRDGYTLFNPYAGLDTYLVDPRGRVVNSWTSQFKPGMSAYLEPGGMLLRCGKVGNTLFTNGGTGGVIEQYHWDGRLVWQYVHSSATEIQHHDIERLPNGNLLMVVWELVDKQEALGNGRNPRLLPDEMLWPDKIVEIEPRAGGGKVVWQWRAWDHLIQDYSTLAKNHGTVAEHPELIDINFAPADTGADWMHTNAVAYNAKLDQIVLSVHHFSEIWIIDHSTTIAEAASHRGGRSGRGGDLLYRWGNPAAYRASTTAGQQLFEQHDAHWIPDGRPGAGNMLIFNNGEGRPEGQYSSVVEIVLPTPDSKGSYPMTKGVWGPEEPAWAYVAPKPTDFFARFVSGAQRLDNGNTLICDGPAGRIFEVTNKGEVVWSYLNPVVAAGTTQQGGTPLGNVLFRAQRYASDDPTLKGLKLEPGGPVESYFAALLMDGSTTAHRVAVGTMVKLSVRAPTEHAFKSYLLATSATAGLTQVGTRFVNVGVDSLLIVSVTGGEPAIFRNYSGVLNASGRAEASLQIPNLPVLAGLELHTTGVVLEKNAPAGIAMIFNTVKLRLDR